MKKKRSETTVYLGAELLTKLDAYRNRFPHPPSVSAVVREAVENYITEKDSDDEMPSLATWVKMTEGHIHGVSELGIDVPSYVILRAHHESSDERVEDLLGGEES